MTNTAPLQEEDNGFTKHGIDHSSPSAINMWASAPCYWVAKYLHGYKGIFGAAPMAGILVEEAVVNVLARGWTEEKALKEALKSFDKRFAIGATEKDLKRRNAMEGMIGLALDELKEFGEPEFNEDGSQQQINLMCNGDGWKLNIMGYMDLVYPQHGLIVDLKTSFRLPSVMSNEHTRQGAIYRQAMGNQTMKFLYVTAKKSGWLEVEDTKPVLEEIKQLLNRQERFLSLGDKDLLKSIVPVNASSFYWTDEQAERIKLYGV